MPRIFISHRWDDHAATSTTSILYDQLVEFFGEDDVLMDAGDVPMTAKYCAELEQEVGSCDILLVVIGPRWVESAYADGTRRLDDPDDYVHIEIATALHRSSIQIFLVLVGQTPMPTVPELPSVLGPVLRHEALAVRADGGNFERDLARLLLKLHPQELTQNAPRAAQPERPPLWVLLGSGVGVLLVFGIGYMVLRSQLPQSQLTTPTAEASRVASIEPPTLVAMLSTNTGIPLVTPFTPTSTDLPTLTETPTTLPTATPATPVVYTARALIARSGPGSDYAGVMTLDADVVLPLIGISEDGAWYQVTLPDGGLGWLAANPVLVESAGDLRGLPFGATPTRTPTDTPTFTPTFTPSDTPTITPSITPTDRATRIPSITPTATLGSGATQINMQTPLATSEFYGTLPPLAFATNTPDGGPTSTNAPPVNSGPLQAISIPATTNDLVPARQLPDFDAPLAFNIPAFALVQVVARSANGGWYKVRYNETTGWVVPFTLQVGGDTATLPLVVVARTIADTSLKNGPLEGADSMQTIPGGALIELVAITRDNLWYHAQVGGEEGWVAVSAVSPASSTSNLPVE
ncbi:MAG: TIR domain-containing protein [Burkholderiales bacterium]|nr:TIR domain-containing protein [Anaerolineae bacterium]